MAKNKFLRNKKGQVFSTFAELAVGVAVLALILTVAMLVLSEGQTQLLSTEASYCTGPGDNFLDSFNTTSYGCFNSSNQGQPEGPADLTHAWNATGTLQGATQDIPGWAPLIIVAVVGGALLSLVALFRRK